MSMSFAQICSGSPEMRETLRRCIDNLGQQGRSCEFSGCLMPEGCVPRQVALGICSTGVRPFSIRERAGFWPPFLPEASGALTAMRP